MLKNTYSLLDTKAQTYTNPFYFAQNGEALRALDGIVNDGQTQVSKYPEDFQLYKIGTFDDVSGEIKGHEPEFIAKALDFKKGHKTEEK